jgi:SAM-dependent methyltransferase
MYYWNARLAWVVTRAEIKGEKKYGIDSLAIVPAKDLDVVGQHKANASEYQPVNYYILEYLFEWLAQKKWIGECLLDYGCGKGRVLAVAAHYGFGKVVGVEFSKSLCDQAMELLASTKARLPQLHYAIVHTDAAQHVPDDAIDTFFFFNPFDEQVMRPVIEQIKASHQRRKRRILILYVNALHQQLWLDAGFDLLHEHSYLTYLQASVLSLDA